MFMHIYMYILYIKLSYLRSPQRNNLIKTSIFFNSTEKSYLTVVKTAYACSLFIHSIFSLDSELPNDKYLVLYLF